MSQMQRALAYGTVAVLAGLTLWLALTTGTKDESGTEGAAESPGQKRRSRKVLVLWAVSLVLLFTGGLLCWKVVVPVWQVRQAVVRHSSCRPGKCACLERLGGPKAAAAKLALFLGLPRWAVGAEGEVRPPFRAGPALRDPCVMLPRARREVALELLLACQDEAFPVLVSLLDHSDPALQCWAVVCIPRFGSRAERAVHRIEKLLVSKAKVRVFGASSGDFYTTGMTWEVRVSDYARDALKKIKAAQRNERKGS